MTISKLELKLETGEVVMCSTAGEGPRIGYIAGGPGSFYFPMLSSLEKDYTFITCDSLWTYKKAEDKATKDFSAITKENMKQRDYLIVKALREKLRPEAIDGWGFSGPGALLFEEALDNPELYDQLIGVGIGVIELDPIFEKTNTLFNKKASSKNQLFFKEYQNKHQQFLSALTQQKQSECENLESLLNFFNVKLKNNQISFKPYEQFVAESIVLLPKLFSDISDTEAKRNLIITHWKHNVFREHLDKEMQKYFFEKVYPQLSTLNTIKKLAVSNHKMLFITGADDYITPWTEEIVSQLQEFETIHIELIPHCGHFPYMESSLQFNQMVNNFIHQGIIQTP